MQWRCIVVAVLLAVGSPAGAQVQSRPTDPPLVTAINESWYQLREPLQFAGDLYYPAGAMVYFNGNTMVRTGHYNGVPLYADTTLEPFSIVFVPVSRGSMQPYERKRRGELAGTTGSTPPSFPVQPVPEAALLPMAAVAPTDLPLPLGAISVYTPEPAPLETVAPVAIVVPAVTAPTAEPVASPATGIPRIQAGAPIVSLRPPENNDGVWIMFGGEKWISAGGAVPLVADQFVRAGEYGSFPVYVRREVTPDVIYLPSREGRIAPYRLKRGRG
jgi:hypothetical protein